MKKLIKKVLFAVMAVTLLITSCKKDKETSGMIEAKTSLRLVHSSFISGASPIDLYVDGVKLNTSESAQFSKATPYFPVSSGSRKITAKDASGAAVADTVINIADGQQYSIFIKDRSWLTETTLERIPLKTHLIAAIDNNTTAPSSGQAKVRFVNTTSQPLNSTGGPVSLYLIDALNGSSQTFITRLLGEDRRTFVSDYSSYNAGEPITFSASAVLASNVSNLTTTLEAGKLYTLYVVSTEHTVRTATKSPISLIMIENK